MTPEQAVARARSMIGKGIRYKLGRGGIDPTGATPATPDGYCDCSGFACWVLGVSRKTDHPLYLKFNQGWINTDAIVADVKTPVGLFSPTVARPGALIVYPRAGKGVGHVGIVTKVVNGKPELVVHCSSGNFKTSGDAVRETPPTVFNGPATVFAWWAGF